jgi:myo-inositol-1(or 4)-monophosphatase
MPSRSEPDAVLEGELDRALEAARVAGEAIMARFRTALEVRHKDPDQPVTEADMEADAILAERLLAGGEYGWLSEETADGPERLSRRRVWVVDPLDGTRSFIAGYREFAVSVALAVDGEAVLGVVYNPACDDVYWATRGGGAFRARHWKGGREGGERLRIADPPSGRTPALLASRSEIKRDDMAPFADGWHVRPRGSTAYKLAGVASGAGEAFISRGPKSEWDVAAGGLIVEEAGGAATDLKGRRFRCNRPDPAVYGVVAGPPGLHAALVERAGGLPAPRLKDRG